MPEIERRSDPALQAEVRQEENGRRIVGYAAVFDAEADIGGMFRERFLPGAFINAIGRDDVRLRIEHTGLPLARTASGTLRLSEDERGLRIEAELDGTDPDVQRVIPKIDRGDLSHMSIAFRAARQTWDESRDPPLRSIEEADLVDVALVTFPAYDQTEVALRSLEAKREAERKQQNFSAAARRIRRKLDLGLRSRRAG